MLEYGELEIYWDGHASVRVEDNGFTVLLDPFRKVTPEVEADLVLVTHEDTGHFDSGILEKVCSENTCVVVPSSIEEEKVPCRDVEFVEESDVIDVFGIEIEAVPMYNEHHERGRGVGYRFEMGQNSFYVAGDTGLTEEMFEIEDRADIAFLPVEGVFTMDVDDAVKSAVRIKPKIVVPYHYGEPFFGNKNPDLRGMKAELEDRNIGCEILKSETDF
ncbi:MAG: MBL fold metallo-hydrolase [Candidatus Paceibacteria bacterium]